jgi:hypothetical protein
MAGFSQNPFCATYFFAAAKKSRQKKPLAKLCSSSNYLANLAGRFQSFPTTENSICFPANCPTKFTRYLANIHARVGQKKKVSASPTTTFVALPLPFPPLKFQQKMAYSWVK